jgi:tetratricopeptide (TPR) repeat protein
MRFKRILFGVASVVLFFVLVEVVLVALGVETLLAERDPFRGFSDSVRVFERVRDRDIYRTHARALVHSFNYQEFPARKPANTFRIFALGGSSTFGFPWGAHVAFPRPLGEALQAAWPDRTVESINAGAMSYGSHRLRILVHELLRYAPDVLVVYGGHNEFVEQRFYRDVLGRRTELDAIRKLLYRWRLYAALTRVYERTRSEPFDPEPGERTTAELLGLDVVREHAAALDDGQVGEAVARLEENLHALVDVAARAGVPVVLCTVPSNVADWVPNASESAADLPPVVRDDVERRLRAAREALDRSAPEEVIRELEPAREQAPGHAEVHYRLGQAYEALERWEQARDAYLRARDTDAQPTRAVGGINEAIRRVATSSDAILVDVEHALERRAPHGLLGFNLFEDYVHPKPRGHQLIAFELWKTFLERGLGGASSPLEAGQFWSAIGQPGPPDLSAQEDAPLAAGGTGNPQLLFNLGVVLENQGRVDEAMVSYRNCLRIDGSHYIARVNLARLLRRAGRLHEAAEEYRAALPLIEEAPDRARALAGLGEALRELGHLDEAADLFERASRADPQSAPAWRGLGGVYAQQNRHADAETAFRRAIALDPTEPEDQANLGFALLLQNRLDEAERVFRAATASRPEHRRSWNGLAAVLTERGSFEEAEQIFRESLRVDPDDRFARGGLDLIATRRGAGE